MGRNGNRRDAGGRDNDGRTGCTGTVAQDGHRMPQMTEIETAVAMMDRSRERSIEPGRRPAEHKRIEPRRQPQNKTEDHPEQSP